MQYKAVSLLTLASFAAAQNRQAGPARRQSFGDDLLGDLEGIGSDVAGEAQSAWNAIESHVPTITFPTSVWHAIETGVKGVPDDVKSAISNGEDAGKAIFDNVKSEVEQHSTLPGWVHSLPSDVRDAVSTDIAKTKSEAEKIESRITATESDATDEKHTHSATHSTLASASATTTASASATATESAETAKADAAEATSTESDNAAPRQTQMAAAGAAGVLGVLGLVAAL
ncbi:hypothetical protein KEM52_001367 [Ascosphaera acerosa]|nr:hypothetical protein KEM52_001367 [Ascosphaera acerosa]